MIDRTHKLSITKQADALGISRGAVYYEPRPTPTADLALMRRIDEEHLEMPWFGARGLRRVLKAEFPGVGRRHIGTLMREMGISAQAPQPGTSRRHRAHPVYPYLLRNRVITRPNEVWAMDITYIPMARGLVYLAAVMDWASRRVLSWRVSNTLVSTFCVAAVEEAIARYGRPEIFNTDQGAQFTSAAFTELLASHGIQISMDGKGLLARQHLRRAPLAYAQVRGDLPARLRHGVGRDRGHHPPLHALQHPSSPLEPRRPYPRRGILHARHPAATSSCGLTSPVNPLISG
jgi:putative transposase